MAAKSPSSSRTPAKRTTGKVVQLVPLSYQGEPIPEDADLRDVLPVDVLEACLERGEAARES